MTSLLSRPRTLALALALVVFCGGAARAETGTCYDTWSLAAAVVKQEGLISVEELNRQAPKRLDGTIIRVTLCKENDRFVYRVVVKSPGGQVRNLTLDARKPFDK